MYKHWLMCYGSLARRALWNVLISRIFRPRTWSPPWCVFATVCRIRTIIGDTGCGQLKDKTISQAWPRWCDAGIRGFCLKHDRRIPTRRSFRRKMRRKRWREFPVIPSKVKRSRGIPRRNRKAMPRGSSTPLGMTRVLSLCDYPISSSSMAGRVNSQPLAANYSD